MKTSANIILIFCATILMSCSVFAQEGAGSADATVEDFFLSLINEQREEKLYKDPSLTQYAEARCEYIVDSGDFSQELMAGKTIYQVMDEFDVESGKRTEITGMVLFRGYVDEYQAARMLYENMVLEDRESDGLSDFLSPDYGLVGVSIASTQWRIGVYKYNAYLCVMAMGSTSTVTELEMLNLINQARAYPSEVAAALRIDLELSGLRSSKPVEMNPDLNRSTAGHVVNMLVEEKMGSVLSDNTTPYERALDNGYVAGLISEVVVKSPLCGEPDKRTETINRSFGRILEQDLEDSLEGNGYSMLMNPAFAEIGIGSVTGESEIMGNLCSKQVQLFVIDMATRNNTITDSGLLYGVLFDDANLNGIYDAGEGIEGRAITLYNLATGYRTEVITDAAGGWNSDIEAGLINITTAGDGSYTERIVQKYGYSGFCAINSENSLTIDANKY